MSNTITWGLFFIAVGLILLLFSFEVIPLSVFSEWWRLWPVVFIILGLLIIVFRNADKIEEVKK
jgi:cell division protein FtsW (lipid II flippase)